MIGDAKSRGAGWNGALFAVLLTLCGAPLCWAAEDAAQALPPPVPLYSSHVTKMNIIGAGMMVISTKDPLDTVLGWYNANLKDRMADVAVGPGHHHYLTRSGAGVDVVVEGSGAKAETKISLFWKSGAGATAQAPAQAQAQPPATAKAQPPEGAGPQPFAQAKNDAPVVVPPKPANADSPTPIEPVNFGQLDLPRVAAMPTPIAQPALKLAAIETIEPPPPAVEPVSFGQLDLPRVAAEPATVAQSELKLAAIEPMALKPPATLPAKKPEAEKPSEPAEAHTPSAEPSGLTLFRAGQYAEALLAWQHAAAAGSVAAALSLGMMYDGGHGVPQNYSEALSWYQLAAEQGSSTGLYNAGVLFDAGLGIPQDTGQAAVFYEKAAAKGSGRAAFNLALLYDRGDGVDQDSGRARKYFSQAAHLGVQAARRRLGTSRRQAVSVADDDDEPFNTVHAIDGEASAGGPKNVAAAMERIRQMADDKDPAAEYDLAYCYEKGIGVEIDLTEAYSLYYRAATGTQDNRLKVVATAAANVVKTHLAAASTSSAVTR